MIIVLGLVGLCAAVLLAVLLFAREVPPRQPSDEEF